MAVNVDTVYKTVLYILNKEQRGYMTPDEFNKVGQQVQLEIFEAYFEELNQLQRQPQTNTEFSDRVQQIQNKIATFEVEGTATFDTSFFYLPSNLHRLGEIYYNDTTIVQPVQQNEYLLINKSPLTSPTLSQPIYVQRGEHTSAVGPPPVLHDKIFVYPTSIQDLIKCSYVKTPAQINWAFTVNSLGAYIFTDTGAQNFELDVSEQTEIILKILQYSGIIIRDPQIVQTAMAQINKEEVNEKK
jgi:hypothetical protein